MKQTAWFDRKFSSTGDSGLIPNLLVRLESSPLFLKQKLWPVDEFLCEKRINNKWSVKEEVGHLIDLEELWSGRFDDLKKKKETLRSADLSNRKTLEANHNTKLLSDLLEEYISTRDALLQKVRGMDSEELEYSSLHPRLQTPMKAVDLAFFIAEHDDHHIARILNTVDALQS